VQVYFEFWPAGYQRANSNYRELIAFLRQQSFRIFDPANETELSDEAIGQLGERLSRAAGYTNLLASRQASVAARTAPQK
jgi:hypothetical protein